jgi:hypothetical protein
MAEGHDEERFFCDVHSKLDVAVPHRSNITNTNLQGQHRLPDWCVANMLAKIATCPATPMPVYALSETRMLDLRTIIQDVISENSLELWK